MTLPYSDPSNPALPSPLFSDLTAVRGDHLRANNAAIFADLDALDARNPALVALTGGSFKTAALANANTYNGRSFFTCTAGVSDTPYSGAWRVFGFWNPTDSSGRFVAMLDSALETWEINYSGAAWGTWTKPIDLSNLTVKNLVYNSDFTLYSNQSATANWYNYKHPDGWKFYDNGSDGKIGYDSSSECCKIVSSSDGSIMSLVQALHEFPRWQGKLRTKKVTAKIRIKGSANITIKLSDGVNTVQQACTGSGSIETIQLQLTLNAAATGLWFGFDTTSITQAIEIYEAYCNLGEIALSGLACQIERIGLWQGMDEAYPKTVMECSAASSLIEIPAGYTRLESWLNGRFGRGANSRSYLPELRGRFLRVWANGSTQDPDRATRTDRGDGTTGDKPGTLQANQNLAHSHLYWAAHPGGGIWPGGSGYGVVQYATDSSGGGNQSNPNNINILAGIRWA